MFCSFVAMAFFRLLHSREVLVQMPCTEEYFFMKRSDDFNLHDTVDDEEGKKTKHVMRQQKKNNENKDNSVSCECTT